MASILDRLTETGLLPELQHLADSLPFWLVGGAVRDGLLGRTIADLDLISPADPSGVARDFAAAVNGHWFWLDESRRHSRVIPGPGRRSTPTIDFAPFRAASLHHDLADRDFTLNAMALPLGRELTPVMLVDPFGGQRDIRAGTIRSVGPAAIANDPLRLLRGLRLAIDLNFTIAPHTLSEMRDAAPQLKETAAERVRQEVWRLLGRDCFARGSEALLEVGAGPALFGSAFAERFAEIRTGLNRLGALFDGLDALRPEVGSVLDEDVEPGLTRGTLLLWTVLLQCAEPGLASEMPRRWLCSRACRKRVAAVAKMLSHAEQIRLEEVAPTGRAVRLWASSEQGDPFDLVLAMGMRSDLCNRSNASALQPYLDVLCAEPDVSLAELVDGGWIMDTFGLPPGAEVGHLQQRIRQGEIRGELVTVDDARRCLHEILSKKD